MTRYDFHNGVMEPIVSNIASPVPVTVPLHLDKPRRQNNREPNLVKKWIGQKKAIKQSQVF